MAHAHIARLNERIAEARAKGMTDQEVINILADVAKSSPQGMKNLLEARDDAVRKNRTNVASAIEQVLLSDGTPVAKGVAHLLDGGS
jgi:pheromone shutdown protein TraB